MLQSSLCPIHSFYDPGQHPCGILIETINVCCLALFTTPYLARISWSPQAACQLHASIVLTSSKYCSSPASLHAQGCKRANFSSLKYFQWILSSGMWAAVAVCYLCYQVLDLCRVTLWCNLYWNPGSKNVVIACLHVHPVTQPGHSWQWLTMTVMCYVCSSHTCLDWISTLSGHLAWCFVMCLMSNEYWLTMASQWWEHNIPPTTAQFSWMLHAGF